MARIRLVQLTVAAAISAALITGCSGGSPQPSPLGGGETTEPVAETNKPSPSSTPSPEASGNPDEKKGTTNEKLDPAGKAEAESTVSAYFVALNSAYKTGKTTEVKGLVHEKCGFCRQLTGYIDDVRRNGGRVGGCQASKPRDVSVSDLYILAGRIRQVSYRAKISGTECVTYSKSGSVVAREPASVENVQFNLEQVGGKWKVRSWELQ